MNHRLACLLAVCLSCLAPSVVHAFGDDDDPVVGIGSLSLDVAIRGRIAVTTMDVVFENHDLDDRAEGVFQWRMSPEAAVHDLYLWVDGRKSRGSLAPRAAARAVYDRIVNARRDPALLEYLGDGLWNLRVFPIPAGQTQRVQVVFTQLLPIEDGQVLYEGPTGTAACSAQEADVLDFHARIKCPGGVKDIEPLSHGLGVRRLKGPKRVGAMAATFRKGRYSLSKAVRFRYLPGEKPPAVAVAPQSPWIRIEGRPGWTDHPRFTAWLPPLAALSPDKPSRRDVVVVVDTSGSLAGDAWKRAKAGAWTLLTGVRETDRFGLVLCASEPRIWRDKLLPGEDKNVGDAQRFLQGIEPSEGTDLSGALRAAASFRQADRPLHVFVVTDGWDHVAAPPRRQPDPNRPPDESEKGSDLPCRVYPLGVAGNVRSLADLAERTGGLALFVYDRFAAPDAAELLWKRVRKRVLTEVHITRLRGSSFAGEIQVHGDLTWSAAGGGRAIAVCGPYKLKGTDKLELRLTAKLDGVPIRQDYALDLANAAKEKWAGDVAVRRVCAHMEAGRMFERLLARGVLWDDLKELDALSRAHHIVTRAASLVVLETAEQYHELGIRRDADSVQVGQTLVEREKDDREEDEIDAGLAKRNAKREAQFRSRLRGLLDKGDLAEADSRLDSGSNDRPWRYGFAAELALWRELVQLRMRLKDEEDERAEEQRLWGGALWHEVAALRTPRQLVPTAALQDVEVAPSELPGDSEAKRLLARKETVEMDGATLSDAVEWLRDMGGLDVSVRWRALKAAGVGKDTKVTVRLGKVPVEKALRGILDAAGKDKAIDYRLDDGQIAISTKDDLPALPMTRVYDVRPLLAAMPSYEERHAWERRQSGGSFGSSAGTFGGDGGGSGGIFADDSGASGKGVVYAARETADPLAEIEHTGVVRLEKGKLIIEPARDRGAGIFDEDDRGPPHYPMPWPFQTRYGAAYDLLRAVRDICPEGQTPFDRPKGYYRAYVYHGLLAVRAVPEAHQAVRGLLRQFRAAIVAGRATSLFGPHWPESLFTRDARVEQWVLDLLGRAREGKLSAHSSAQQKEIAGRKLVRIGGVWFDTALTGKAKIYVVARHGAAAEAVKAAAPKLKPCFDLPDRVVLAAGEELALCLDTVGIHRRDNPDLKRLLAVLAK